MQDVEAQPLGRDQRPLLRDVRAEPFPQGGVQQVGGRVIGPDRGPAVMVDNEVHGVADRHLAAFDLELVRPQSTEMLVRIGDGAL